MKNNIKNNKKTTNIQKVFNLLKTGKKVSAQTLTKKVYGEYTENNYKSVRAVISKIRNYGYDVESLGNKMYKMN